MRFTSNLIRSVLTFTCQLGENSCTYWASCTKSLYLSNSHLGHTSSYALFDFDTCAHCICWAIQFISNVLVSCRHRHRSTQVLTICILAVDQIHLGILKTCVMSSDEYLAHLFARWKICCPLLSSIICDRYSLCISC